jgi:hypothetical protein
MSIGAGAGRPALGSPWSRRRAALAAPAVDFSY